NLKLTNTKLYDYYVSSAQIPQEKGVTDVLIDFFLSLQIWGTPEQCFEKILAVRARVGCDTFIPVFSYAGMPHEEAERNMRLFAREVLPELQRVDGEMRAAAPSSA